MPLPDRDQPQPGDTHEAGVAELDDLEFVGIIRYPDGRILVDTDVDEDALLSILVVTQHAYTSDVADVAFGEDDRED